MLLEDWIYLAIGVACVVFVIRTVRADRRQRRLYRAKGPGEPDRCNICHEPYVGLANDCRCTNFGK